jgi:hypothetical protein
MPTLSDSVKKKLGAAIQEWADENLSGRPGILGYMVYSSVEKALLDKQAEIEETFPLEAPNADAE